MLAMFKANERCYKRKFGLYGFEALNYRSELKILWDIFRSQIAELWFPYDRRMANDRRWSQTIAEDRTWFYLLRSSAIAVYWLYKLFFRAPCFLICFQNVAIRLIVIWSGSFHLSDNFQYLAQEAGRCYTRQAALSPFTCTFNYLISWKEVNTVLIYLYLINERLLILSLWSTLSLLVSSWH